MREYPTKPAKVYAGAITYHFGNAIVRDVASENASDVCPEGKDRLEAGVNTEKVGSVSPGLFLLIVFLSR